MVRILRLYTEGKKKHTHKGKIVSEPGDSAAFPWLEVIRICQMIPAETEDNTHANSKTHSEDWAGGVDQTKHLYSFWEHDSKGNILFSDVAIFNLCGFNKVLISSSD